MNQATYPPFVVFGFLFGITHPGLPYHFTEFECADGAMFDLFRLVSLDRETQMRGPLDPHLTRTAWVSE